MSDGGDKPVRVEVRGEPGAAARIRLAEALRRGRVVPAWTAEEQARWRAAGAGERAESGS